MHDFGMTVATAPRLIGFLVVLASIGCRQHSDSSGQRLVVAEGTIEGVPRLRAVPEMRIDGYAADLVPVNWLGVSSNGTIAVLQSQDHVVHFFDSTGSLIATVGREGEGPGEFRTLVRAGWKADSLWVSDPLVSRVTLLSPEGKLLRTLPRLASVSPLAQDSTSLPTFGFVFPYAVYDGDSMLMTAQSGDPRAEALGGMPLLKVSPDGWIRRVVTLLPVFESSVRVPLPRGGVASAPVPYFPRLLWGVSPNGRVIAKLVTNIVDGSQGSLMVTLINAEDDESSRREIPFVGVPIPHHAIDSVIRVRIENATRSEVKRVYETEVRDLVPDVYPPVEELVVDNDHRVWLGLRPTSRGKPWLVLDAAGVATALVALPVNSSVQAADGNRVWVVESDELDVESIVRYRLDPAQ